MPSLNITLSGRGLPFSNTDAGPPERIMPTGLCFCISDAEASKGKISAFTPRSRTRLAMRWANWLPKLRIMTIVNNITNYWPNEPYFTSVQSCQSGGDGWRNFEPVVSHKTVSFTRIDKIIRELRRIYKENPAYFDVPAFAQKVY